MAPARRNGGGSAAVLAAPATMRCAIYTRKSTDEGLDKDFNTLDAQRAAAEDYIRSQRLEGWTALPDRYDDGGFSGATMRRPALQRLVADAEAGRIDLVVVYKLDRLSRSVRDYLNFLAFLEEHDVDFVSVSQRFDTSTPLGSMTLKQLLLFAEFERDLTAERTRDKMRAARRRGRWTGGMPPLGYDVAPEGGRLLVNGPEAEQVRAIFDLYLEKASLVAVAQELSRRGWRRKSWTTRTGQRREGSEWDAPTLRRLLRDPLYAGLQKLGRETFPGEHKAIVTRATFDRVQKVMKENRRTGGSGPRNRQGALLRGLLRCGTCNSAMIHTWTRRGTRVHRYYTCSRAQKRGSETCPTKPIRAEEVERFVIDQIRAIGADPDLQAATFRQAITQLAGRRRSLRAEAKRLEPEMARSRREVSRLVAAVAEADGGARSALLARLGEIQSRLATVETRLAGVRSEQEALDGQEINESDLRRALESFEPIWDVLLTPEKEQVLNLLIERVVYDTATERMSIEFRLPGLVRFAAEMDGEAES